MEKEKPFKYNQPHSKPCTAKQPVLISRGKGHKPDSVSRKAGSVIHLMRSTRNCQAPCPFQDRHKLRRVASDSLLFDLAPSGVCHAASITGRPGSLLHYLFTLIPTHSRASKRYILCGTFRLFRFTGRPPRTTQGRSTLWSPDFPPRKRERFGATDHPLPDIQNSILPQ